MSLKKNETAVSGRFLYFSAAARLKSVCACVQDLARPTMWSFAIRDSNKTGRESCTLLYLRQEEEFEIFIGESAREMICDGI